ncbi:hypothetical protein NF27_JC00010 [Candidatus Jidaibacter acanthamoeba]|uniref:Uncharacterized protein n=1 Tax=Candidatus Jidaibacter acanthamoebae TaxID=86105 RepID=A0A0C1QF61_9RICK|nr:hypothetical protein NF27_JC00010 [Candidatus Jidaibacter acanthamoeba]
MSYHLYCLPEIIIRFARNLLKQSLQDYFNYRFPFLSKNINWDSSGVIAQIPIKEYSPFIYVT